MKLNLSTLAIFTVVVLAFFVHTLTFPLAAPAIAGLAIAIPSFLLFVAARLQLGRSFSVEARASQLVTTGIYARIRNPIYVFGALTVAGIIISTRHPWFLLCFLVLVPLQIRRSRKEARVLEERFGAQYLEYKRKTWF